MSRKAFLIASPLVKGQSGYLNGVTPDIKNMKKHLQSLSGGAWNEDEIVVFTNPTKKELFEKLSGSYDFALIQYSGHGFEYTKSGVQLDINPTESVSLVDVLKLVRAPRRYCFIDACRGIQPEAALESLAKIFDSLKGESEDYARLVSRARYADLVSKCEIGTSYIFSCSENESAAEDKDGFGGAFSLSYLKAAKRNTSDESLSIQDVFVKAIPLLRQDFSYTDQTPEMLPERRKSYFPFTIKVT